MASSLDLLNVNAAGAGGVPYVTNDERAVGGQHVTATAGIIVLDGSAVIGTEDSAGSRLTLTDTIINVVATHTRGREGALLYGGTDGSGTSGRLEITRGGIINDFAGSHDTFLSSMSDSSFIATAVSSNGIIRVQAGGALTRTRFDFRGTGAVEVHGQCDISGCIFGGLDRGFIAYETGGVRVSIVAPDFDAPPERLGFTNNGGLFFLSPTIGGVPMTRAQIEAMRFRTQQNTATNHVAIGKRQRFRIVGSDGLAVAGAETRYARGETELAVYSGAEVDDARELFRTNAVLVGVVFGDGVVPTAAQWEHFVTEQNPISRTIRAYGFVGEKKSYSSFDEYETIDRDFELARDEKIEQLDASIVGARERATTALEAYEIYRLWEKNNTTFYDATVSLVGDTVDFGARDVFVKEPGNYSEAPVEIVGDDIYVYTAGFPFEGGIRTTGSITIDNGVSVRAVFDSSGDSAIVFPGATREWQVFNRSPVADNGAVDPAAVLLGSAPGGAGGDPGENPVSVSPGSPGGAPGGAEISRRFRFVFAENASYWVRFSSDGETFVAQEIRPTAMGDTEVPADISSQIAGIDRRIDSLRRDHEHLNEGARRASLLIPHTEGLPS